MRALLTCVLLSAACSPTIRACAKDTVQVNVDFDAITRTADTLSIDVNVQDGTLTHTSLPETSLPLAGGLQITFPHGYPKGKLVRVTITATKNGITLGVFDQQNTATAACMIVNGPLHASAQLDLRATDDASAADLSGVDQTATSNDLTATSTDDLAPPDDLVNADLSSICTAGATQCSSATLQTCKPDQTGYTNSTCALGCIATAPAHCKTIVPSAPATVADFDTTGLTNEPTITNAVLHSDTGAITSSEITRGANDDAATYQVLSGIGFHLVTQTGGPNVGVWTFRNLIALGKYTVTGTAAVSLVVVGDLQMQAEFDAFGGLGCTSASGSAGGFGGGTASAGAGTGGGGKGAGAFGAAGGGYGDVGGTGGAGFSGSVGAVGPAWGVATDVPLVGGSGGGACGHSGTITGGAGGGAVQLVATNSITLGGGTNPGGVNVGGCGGNHNNGDCGSAGGSGGAILVESATVTLLGNARLAANGGGGGGSDTTEVTGTGGIGDFGRNGGVGGYSSATGSCTGGYGGGGFSGMSAGGVGQDHSSGEGCGGGGGVGRIRINTINALVQMSGSIVSPTVGSTQSTTGTLSTQ